MKDKEARIVLGMILDMHLLDGDLERKTWELAKKRLGFTFEEHPTSKSSVLKEEKE